MRLNNPFKELTRFELILWLCSLSAVTVSFIIPSECDWLTLIASIIGVTALMFVAKGNVFGQILTVVFALFYGVISFCFRYYGEMITYLCMSAPMATLSVISWLKNPFGESMEVKVNRMSKKQILIMLLWSAVVTFTFWYILKALNNANLLFSTISVTTSFLASYMTFMRSPYYAVGYALNDIVLIVLWMLASARKIEYIPMAVCFVMFFINDVYGFCSWQRMQKRQEKMLLKNENK